MTDELGTTISYERPWLYEKQSSGIFATERYSCVEASTKSGKTHGCLIWIVEQALGGQPGWNYWWVAPVSDQSDIAFRRLKRMIPPEFYEANETRKIIELANGTTIWCKSAERPDLLYGEDVYAAVVDEASRVKNESWYAVRSTLTYTQGPIRLIGNVKGRGNWFYKLARRAQAGHPGMHYEKITAWDAVEAGVLPLEEVLDAMDVYPENVFRELYEAEPADDGGNPFGLEHIAACTFRGEDGRPTSQVASGDPVAWAWDVAKGYNFTVGIGLNDKGQVCRYDRFQLSWEMTFSRIKGCTGMVIPALIDSTPGSAGDPLLERLHGDGHNNFTGYAFSVASKQTLMQGLALEMQSREVSFPEGPIVNELEAFEYEIGKPQHGMNRVYYAAAEGFNDDCVDSLALAVYCKRQYAAHYDAIVPSMVVGTNYFRGAG